MSITPERASFKLALSSELRPPLPLPDPAGPVGPAGPVLPAGPVGPVLPCAPVVPAVPAGPVGPAGPALPAGPAGPCASAIAIPLKCLTSICSPSSGASTS